MEFVLRLEFFLLFIALVTYPGGKSAISGIKYKVVDFTLPYACGFSSLLIQLATEINRWVPWSAFFSYYIVISYCVLKTGLKLQFSCLFLKVGQTSAVQTGSLFTKINHISLCFTFLLSTANNSYGEGILNLFHF